MDSLSSIILGVIAVFCLCKADGLLIGSIRLMCIAVFGGGILLSKYLVPSYAWYVITISALSVYYLVDKYCLKPLKVKGRQPEKSN